MRRLRRAAPQRATLRELLPLHQTARRRPHLYELRRADPAHRAAGAAAVTTAWSRHFALTRPSAKLPRSSATTGGRHATATGQSTTLDNIPVTRWNCSKTLRARSINVTSAKSAGVVKGAAATTVTRLISRSSSIAAHRWAAAPVVTPSPRSRMIPRTSRRFLRVSRRPLLLSSCLDLQSRNVRSDGTSPEIASRRAKLLTTATASSAVHDSGTSPRFSMAAKDNTWSGGLPSANDTSDGIYVEPQIPKPAAWWSSGEARPLRPLADARRFVNGHDVLALAHIR